MVQPCTQTSAPYTVLDHWRQNHKNRSLKRQSVIVFERRNTDCPNYAKCLAFAARYNDTTLGCDACRDMDERIANNIRAKQQD